MIRQVYGDKALGRSALFKWQQRSVERRNSLKDDERRSDNNSPNRMQDRRGCNGGER